MYKFIKESNTPFQIKKASLLLATYAFWVLIGTIWYAVDTNFEQSKELFRGVLRFAGVTGIAWWLLSLNKNSWWFAIIASGLFATMGIIGIVTFSFLASTYDSAYIKMILKLSLPTYLLSHAFIILIKSESRKLFTTQ